MWNCWVGIPGFDDKVMFTFKKKRKTGLQSGFIHFTFLPTVYKSYSCPMSSSTRGIVSLFNLNNSSGYVIVSQYDYAFNFNLRFPYDLS